MGWAGRNSLVIFWQAGHSYAIRPGSFWSGAILMISRIDVWHRGKATPLLRFERSDTRTHPTRRTLSASIRRGLNGFPLRPGTLEHTASHANQSLLARAQV